MLDLDQLLCQAVERGASDVHIKVGSPPYFRVDGRLQRTEHPATTPVETERMAFAIMPKPRAEDFMATSEADFAYSVAGLGRFRVNVMRQRSSVGLVLRRVQSDIHSLDELGLPAVVPTLADQEHGLVLVVGGAASGKTTTLGSIIDYINERYDRHIVTIEEPIEILHADKMSIVNQREVGTDTTDFRAALKHVLRQDLDVLLVGELRDVETVRTVLAVAETGNLVLSAMNAMNAADTVARLVDFFPPQEQHHARLSLAASLRGIVTQRLVHRRGGGRVPAVEVLTATNGVVDRIQAGAFEMLDELIAAGGADGMQTFNQSLCGLYEQGLIDLRAALAASPDPRALRTMMEEQALEGAARGADA